MIKFMKINIDTILLSKYTFVGSQTDPHTQGAGRGDRRKRQATPEWQVTDLMSKGTYTQSLSWAATKRVDLSTFSPEC